MQAYYVAAVLLIFAFGSLFWHIENQEDVIASLEKSLVDAQADRIELELEKSECRTAVDKQNELLVGMRIEYEKRAAKLEKRKELSPQTRYEVIYKTIPNMEVESDECKDIKNMLDSIRANGL